MHMTYNLRTSTHAQTHAHTSNLTSARLDSTACLLVCPIYIYLFNQSFTLIIWIYLSSLSLGRA